MIIITVEPVHSGHPGDYQKWRGDLLAQIKIHAIDSIWTLPPGCYRKVTCLYSDRYIYRFIIIMNNRRKCFAIIVVEFSSYMDE